MFFELISRNSRRNRRENGLFFSSLVVSIIAFYLILSLENQDVMKFLKIMESDAVDKLFIMIPLFYLLTLFILFFLLYFAGKYQFESRSHEFGMYQMLGMRRTKLFFLLLAEDMKNSNIALLVGIPIGIAISELISIITAKLVGLGIWNHTFGISVKAIVFTIVGFTLIKLCAFFLLSGKIAGKDIDALLHQTPAGSRKKHNSVLHMLSFGMGVLFLIVAYTLAITGFSWQYMGIMALTLLSGLLGTLLLFFGMRSFIERKVSKRGNGQTLHVFTFRQIQEEVVQKSSTMAISSLLMLAALCCFGCGVAIAIHFAEAEEHNIDYTFVPIVSEYEKEQDIRQVLKEKNLDHLFSEIIDMKVGYIQAEDDDHSNVFVMENVMDQLRELPQSEDRDVLLNNLSYATYPHLISLSGYNELLKLAGKEEIQIVDNEAVVYMDDEFTSESRNQILNQIMGEYPAVWIRGDEFHLTGKIQSTNLVVDRSITLSFALIVTDQTFADYVRPSYEIYQNAVMSVSAKEGKSLLNAVADTNSQLSNAGIEYESYLQNLGRKMFYVSAASYITIYLAIVFLIIANTIIGIQFLTRQQQTRGRYQSLIRIGATCEALQKSAGSQIHWYFGMPVAVAALSSLFGVRALFTGLLSYYTENDLVTLMLIAACMILLLAVTECIYMLFVKKSSDNYLLALMVPEREE